MIKQSVASLGVPKFSLGRLVVSAGVTEKINPLYLLPSLCRHCAGNWRETEKTGNEYGLLYRSRIVSQHSDDNGRSFYIVTSSDRSQTILVLAEEY